MQGHAEAPVDDARALPLGNDRSFLHGRRIAERLRMRADGDLVHPPVAWMFLRVKRVRQIVDVRVLQELTQRVADGAAALDLVDVAVLKVNFPAWKEPGMVRGAGNRPVEDRHRLARKPLVLKRGIVDDGIPESAGG